MKDWELLGAFIMGMVCAGFIIWVVSIQTEAPRRCDSCYKKIEEIRK